ncbi:NAD(P)H-dependent flavin oxidoreductase [Oceanobacillus kapialis]|uniref:Probable nitronate monooxygenase n=1 Tax=Oceanobacillus kapialis TaxID=481353 RepID=A0ABW5PYY9_9BACI
MEWKTKVTKLLDIKYPIVQGGLAYLAYADLAAAVSNAGGLGQITAMSLPDEHRLREEIQKVKSLTDKPFGVNLAIGQHGRPYDHMLQVVLEEKVPVLSITGGNPKDILNKAKGEDIKTLVLVAAKRQAVKAEELGADAVMVVGYEGGGHLGRGDMGTMVLTPFVGEHVSIPVIASGGIVDGKGLMAALALGAEGVEMGTRFIATKECVDAHVSYKQAILNAGEVSTVVIKRSIGTPARALRNSWTEQILEMEKLEPGYDALKDLISGQANQNYIINGDEQMGFGWSGQGAARINDISPVDEVIQAIIKEAEQIRTSWQ